MRFADIARAAGAILVAMGAIAMLACGGNRRMQYEPWEVAAAERAADARPLSFRTKAGQQTAFYLPPTDRPDAPPRTLVLLYPGIASRALDWLNWLEFKPPRRSVGYLLIDYPGRGMCEGAFRPKGLAANSQGALEALARELEVRADSLCDDIALVGHSFGSGAAMQYALQSAPRRIVLIAPFTTLHRALFRRVGPLAWLLPNGMDNLDALEQIAARPEPPEVLILHGVDDKSLPASMGRKLAKRGGATTTFEELPETGHVDILYKRRDEILKWARGDRSD